VPLLFALDQQLIVSFAAPLASLILVSRETLLQTGLLSVVLSVVILSLVLVQVQSGGVAILRWFLVCLQASFTVLLTLFLPLRRRAVVTTCLRKVKYRITAPPRVPRLAVPPLSDAVNEEANVRANTAVVDGHANVRASAVMTDDNDDDVDVGNL